MKTVLFFSLLLSSLGLLGGEGHGHKENHKEDYKQDRKEDHKTAHKDEHDDHGDEHGEHNEEASADGFKLNEKSTKKFGIQTLEVKDTTLEVPREAIFKGLSEVNVYRLREGLYKRVDFKTIENKKETLKISSAELKTGDRVVVGGVGFLRIAEIAASGGISDSHSH